MADVTIRKNGKSGAWNMKIGDVVVNPHAVKDFKTKPNPVYLLMIIHIGNEYTRLLRYDGLVSKYYTREVKTWSVTHNVNLYELIYNGRAEFRDDLFGDDYE